METLTLLARPTSRRGTQFTMTHEFTMHYDARILWQSTRRFIRRTFGWDFWLCWLVVVMALACLLWLGDRGWMVGAAGTMAILAPSFVALLTWMTYRRGLRNLESMAEPVVQVTLDEEGIRTTSDLGGGQIKWSRIHEVYQAPECLLVFISQGNYSAFPSSSLTPEARAFLLDHVRAAGGRIR